MDTEKHHHVGIYGDDQKLLWQGIWESEDAVRALNEHQGERVWVVFLANAHPLNIPAGGNIFRL